jgi:hypothetical protein
MEHIRIDLRRLTVLLLFSLVLPLSALLLLDYATGWFPWLTIVASAICIPLSTVIVIRATLAEMDRVIQIVAPLHVASDEADPVVADQQV